ncbi:MAG: 1-(5-phosphoribosyl)-5-[Synergistaceae bacterium]|nr:1-(5-phosphoribosyl)-5-[(5-phosphoribosylamino)methylideneamino]imidazole-4-carboxamide isomerase [Synergistaceae bacterium]MBQ7168602.1 1-(5-phosphoribosyl)-5-[(5-phosphoribosylamino)methylideneamino]imidazole-4-carboxamide isomerase [Synergistaceae bacterium]
MIILPAIDIFGGQAVRLLRGNYDDMTIYDPDPVNTAMIFRNEGAKWIHVVDLEGAKSGGAVNLPTIMRIREACGLKCEVGGGIRDMPAISRYVEAGVDRVILGTSATKEGFAREAVKLFGDKIAVGVDIRGGKVAVKGWLEDSGIDALTFCRKMQDDGVATLIITDISRDGAMSGTNTGLYAELSRTLSVDITASGGVSTLEDVRTLAGLGLYGAIIGKAYYTGAVKISEAIGAVKE